MYQRLLAVAFSVALAHASNAQDEPSQSVNYFANVSAGFGMIYGGLGGNAELGAKHFAVFGAFGYAPPINDLTIMVPSSYNYHFGLRYYANVGSPYIFPRIGIGYGWIGNYYNQKIGTAAYDHSVEGMSLQLGLQFYSFEGLVFSFDAAMGSSLLITNPNSHPHFFDFYIRPCIGIGYDIARIINKDRATQIRNREISPFD